LVSKVAKVSKVQETRHGLRQGGYHPDTGFRICIPNQLARRPIGHVGAGTLGIVTKSGQMLLRSDCRGAGDQIGDQNPEPRIGRWPNWVTAQILAVSRQIVDCSICRTLYALYDSARTAYGTYIVLAQIFYCTNSIAPLLRVYCA
jgi:hypothetical protein